MTTQTPAVVHAALGPPLGQNATGRRLVGRIGGAFGNFDDRVRLRLAESLGAGAQLLFCYPSSIHSDSANSPTRKDGVVVADCDGCRLDRSPIEYSRDWSPVLEADRLADVQGAFALAWSDPDAALLRLARDSIGERTLFYACVNHGLIFASSIRALLETELVPRRLNVRSVATYLSYAYLPGRETLVGGVYELLPGELLTFGLTGMHRKSFWELPAASASPASEEELTRSLRLALEEAVCARLPASDEPVGAFLSGGLDSSLVVALARRHHPAPVHTYSVSFGAGHANELEFSSLVADHCGTDHQIVELSPAAVLHHLDDSIGLLSDPIGDPLTVPNALLFREAASRVGVVLNGEGGDPCFGGPKNLPMILSELYGGANRAGREASYLRAHLKCYDDLPVMLSDSARDVLAASPLENELAPQLCSQTRPDFIARLQALNIRLKGAHHILPKVDALSFPFGVLPRSPLFDRSVVELSLLMPARLKLHGSVEKYLLKQAVRDLLPASIVQRPKSGMLVPVEGWFRGPLLPAARERLLDGLQPYDLFQRSYLERILNGKLGGLRPRHGAKLWLLVTLESWLRRVLSR